MPCLRGKGGAEGKGVIIGLSANVLVLVAPNFVRGRVAICRDAPLSLVLLIGRGNLRGLGFTIRKNPPKDIETWKFMEIVEIRL